MGSEMCIRDRVLYDRDSLAVSRKLFASVEEYIDDHYVQLQ